MGTIVDRLKLLLKEYDMSENKFASEIGVKSQTLNTYTSGKRGVSYDVVEKILAKFPQISAEWLIRGVGNMCCAPQSDINTLFNAQGDNSTNQQIVGASNEALIKENEMLKQLLEEKERMIQVLLKK